MRCRYTPSLKYDLYLCVNCGAFSFLILLCYNIKFCPDQKFTFHFLIKRSKVKLRVMLQPDSSNKYDTVQ